MHLEMGNLRDMDLDKLVSVDMLPTLHSSSNFPLRNLDYIK